MHLVALGMIGAGAKTVHAVAQGCVGLEEKCLGGVIDLPVPMELQALPRAMERSPEAQTSCKSR